MKRERMKLEGFAGHTPGPWRTPEQLGHGPDGNNSYALVWDAAGRCVADLTLRKHTMLGGSGLAADVRLIAAAPELLEEVRNLRKELAAESKRLRQALAQAEMRHTLALREAEHLMRQLEEQNNGAS